MYEVAEGGLGVVVVLRRRGRSGEAAGVFAFTALQYGHDGATLFMANRRRLLNDFL